MASQRKISSQLDAVLRGHGVIHDVLYYDLDGLFSKRDWVAFDCYCLERVIIELLFIFLLPLARHGS